jgi:hypothetical protein
MHDNSSNQKTKRKYRKHDWPAHIKQWQESGLKQNEYCSKYNLNRQQFSKYKKQLTDAPKSVSPKFIKIPAMMDKHQSPAHDCEIILPGNIRIRISNNFNPEILKKLIRTLQEV